LFDMVPVDAGWPCVVVAMLSAFTVRVTCGKVTGIAYADMRNVGNTSASDQARRITRYGFQAESHAWASRSEVAQDVGT